MINLFTSNENLFSTEVNDVIGVLPYDTDLDSMLSSETLAVEGVNYDNESKLKNDVPIQGGSKRPPVCVIFNKKTLEDNTCLWTFFLNTQQSITDDIVMDLSTKLLQAKATDKILIHVPCSIGLFLSKTIVSLLQTIDCKNITMSAAFCCGLGSVYLLTAASRVITSKCSMWLIDSPTAIGYGKITDAQHGLLQETSDVRRILNKLVKHNIITEYDVEHVLQHQGMVCKHPNQLNK